MDPRDFAPANLAEIYMQGLQLRGQQEDRAFRRQQYESQRRKTEYEQRRDMVLSGAKIIRAFNPKDNGTWKQALAAASQIGLPLDDVPQDYDPAYVQQFMAIANALDKESSNRPAMQENYEFLQNVDPSLARKYLDRQTSEPPMIANNGDGTFTVIPKSQMQEPSGRPVTKVEYDALPPGAEYIAPDGSRRRKGGASPVGSHNFP